MKKIPQILFKNQIDKYWFCFNTKSRQGTKYLGQERQSSFKNINPTYREFQPKQNHFFQPTIIPKLDDTTFNRKILSVYNYEPNQDQVNTFFQEHDIQYAPVPIKNQTKPILSWDQYPFPISLIQKLDKFEAPTVIQSTTMPLILDGYDTIGLAKTGSGKTLAFLIPAILHIKQQLQDRQVKNPISIILAPTRELAIQIEQEIQQFFGSSIKSACLYGGAPKFEQKYQLRRKPQLIVATPGRLNDFLQENALDLSQVTQVILDEADRMLDMGFEPQIRSILQHVRKDRQTVMFSATWPKDIQDLVQDYTNVENLVRVQIGEEGLTLNNDITQFYELMYQDQKLERLKQHLDQFKEGHKVLIFCNTKTMCQQLNEDLYNYRKYRSQTLHGDMDQKQREKVLQNFKQNLTSIVIATDVASRGLDINDITHIINYDMPNNIEDYVHRIGRTGRAGKKGRSISFISNKDSGIVQSLIDVLIKTGNKVTKSLVNYCQKKIKLAKLSNDFQMDEIHSEYDQNLQNLLDWQLQQKKISEINEEQKVKSFKRAEFKSSF